MIRYRGVVFAVAALFAGASTYVAAQGAPAPNVAAGQAFFQQRCMMCHVVAPGKPGIMAPNLSGLPGSVSGVGDYQFSPALKKAKIKWTAETLDQFLTAPSKVVPGTRMITAVPDPAKRAQVIAYLMTLKR